MATNFSDSDASSEETSMSTEDKAKRSASGLLVPSRRNALRAGLSLAALPVLNLVSPRIAQAATSTVQGFETGADVAAAEKEGNLVFYTHDSGAAAAAICDAFHKDFPKINARYVSLQNGSLFSKILAERGAGRYEADVIQFSDLGTAIDFQGKGGYDEYHSPQQKYYSKDQLSDPAGHYFWIAMGFNGMAYCTDQVKDAEAPKVWKDLLDPKWRGKISVKQANSGTQFTEWYELRKLYGDEYWKEFAKQKPKGFNARVQVYDRLARGDDSVAAMAEWAGYQLAHEKKAPIKFVAPQDGLPASPMANGIVSKAPNPQAARLFTDWLMSLKGQVFYQDNPYLFYGSIRKDAPPMPGGLKLTDFKLLVPTDMKAYLASRNEFNSQWNQMLGLL